MAAGVPQDTGGRKPDRLGSMILIGLGSNMTGPWGAPRDCVCRAVEVLGQHPFELVSASSLIETTPYGVPDQPTYINAVAQIETHLLPLDLLQALREVERSAGRKRHVRWGARTLDLDILDYNGMVLKQGIEKTTDADLVLPHPAISDREFVLAPIAEIAPRWTHPVTGQTARSMLAALDPDKGGKVIGDGTRS